MPAFCRTRQIAVPACISPLAIMTLLGSLAKMPCLLPLWCPAHAPHSFTHPFTLELSPHSLTHPCKLYTELRQQIPRGGTVTQWSDPQLRLSLLVFAGDWRLCLLCCGGAPASEELQQTTEKNDKAFVEATARHVRVFSACRKSMICNHTSYLRLSVFFAGMRR